MTEESSNAYIYAYLDPRKAGIYNYGGYLFEYEPFYIGKGTGRRWKSHLLPVHLKTRSPKNSKIKSILSSGLEPVIVKVIEGLTDSDAFIMEELIVDCVGRLAVNDGPLTNMTKGGIGASCGEANPMWGKTHTDEVKAILSARVRPKGKDHHAYGKDILTPNQRKELTERQKARFKGEGNPNFGVIPSAETRAKISAGNKGKLVGEKNHNFGKPMPESVKEKLRAARVGFRHTEEDKLKMQEYNSKYHYKVYKNDELIYEGNGLDKFAREFKEFYVDPSGLRKMVKNGKLYKSCLWFTRTIKEK